MTSAFSRLIGALLLATMASPAHGQEAPSVEQLQFLEGHWTRTTDGMLVEQVFLPPAGGTIVGLQRRTRGEKTLVSYFFILHEAESELICRFKHFENDYTTYEDRNQTGPRSFRWVEGTERSATFEERTDEGALYLRYRLTETGRLGIAVGSLEELRTGSATESLHDRVDVGD